MDLLVRLGLIAGVGLAAWAGAWGLRRYLGNAQAPSHFQGEPGARLVTFSGPYCLECQEIRPRLVAAAAGHGVPLQVIDIKQSPELANRYRIRLTPTTLVVGSGGAVQASWLGTPPDGAVEAALGSLAGASPGS